MEITKRKQGIKGVKYAKCGFCSRKFVIKRITKFCSDKCLQRWNKKIGVDRSQTELRFI